MSGSGIEVSFEFFPPEDGAAPQFLSTVERLARFEPKFVSITCGAGGTSRPRTRRWVQRLLRMTSLQVVPHLTCIGASRQEIQDCARHYWDAGIRQLVALRGDHPSIPESVKADDAGFDSAARLVSGLREVAPFGLFVAAYPEGHPENPGMEADVQNLKRKVAAGATRAITQFFFDHDAYLSYRDRCAAVGIHIPIIPGILPIGRLSQVERFAARCGASVPGWLRSRFEGTEGDEGAQGRVAAEVAIEQVELLMQHGVKEFHFYTLNRAGLTGEICHEVGIRPSTPAACVANL